MEPLTLMGIASAVQGIGGLLGARKERKAQRQAEKEQRKSDSLSNLLNLMMGSTTRPETAVTTGGGSPIADTLLALGQIGSGIASMKADKAKQDKLLQLEQDKLTSAENIARDNRISAERREKIRADAYRDRYGDDDEHPWYRKPKGQTPVYGQSFRFD